MNYNKAGDVRNKKHCLVFLLFFCLSFFVSFPVQYMGETDNLSGATTTMAALPKQVIVSGEAIGVKIESQGVLVVGLSCIINENGEKVTPAADAGIEIGDLILSINGETVEKEQDIIDHLNEQTADISKLDVLVSRDGKQMHLDLIPVKSQSDHLNKIGLWVRDNIAGVGTMTFIDPATGTFGALGHGITDVDSGTLVSLDKGVIIKSKITSVQKARKSLPGELVGVFYENKNSYGAVKKNCPFGIYGTVDLNHVDRQKMFPVASCDEIEEGPAQIYATIHGSEVKAYNIRIQKVYHQKTADGKSMIIEVTDKNLLDKTGGIVQGMSGSPIIQNNKLVGAVTHVLINNPTKGYGISAEWMINASRTTAE